MKNQEGEKSGKKYRIVYHKHECIGAFACLAAEPSTWKQADDKADIVGGKLQKSVSTGKSDEQIFHKDVNDLENNLEAAQSCPVNCIHIYELKTGKKLI